MGQDKYTKFVLTVIAFSLFWIALNLSVIEFVLYDFYNGEIKKYYLEFLVILLRFHQALMSFTYVCLKFFL